MLLKTSLDFIKHGLFLANGDELTSKQPPINGVLSHHPPPGENLLTRDQSASMDILLPPPPEFQEKAIETPGYGDYEILTQRINYSDLYNNIHQRGNNSSTIENRLKYRDKFDSKVNQRSTTAPYRNSIPTLKSAQQLKHPLTQRTYYSSHHQQYSTEL